MLNDSFRKTGFQVERLRVQFLREEVLRLKASAVLTEDLRDECTEPFSSILQM